MEWTVHGERTIYDSEWMRLALVDVELPSGARFPADACKAVCRECDGPLHDPCESRGSSFGCDTCC